MADYLRIVFVRIKAGGAPAEELPVREELLVDLNAALESQGFDVLLSHCGHLLVETAREFKYKAMSHK
jgi:hypothetical protein